VSAFTIDRTPGSLAEVAGSPFPTDAAPNALAVDPTGGFLYVANSSSNELSVFSINGSSGMLSQIGGSPFSTSQQNLSGVAIAKTH